MFRELVKFLQMKFRDDRIKECKLKKREEDVKKKLEKKNETSSEDCKIAELEKAFSDSTFPLWNWYPF